VVTYLDLVDYLGHRARRLGLLASEAVLPFEGCNRVVFARPAG
jgi:hypothetical protein